jgi:hypothetical protein
MKFHYILLVKIILPMLQFLRIFLYHINNNSHKTQTEIKNNIYCNNILFNYSNVINNEVFI